MSRYTKVIPGYEVEIVEHPIEMVLNRLSDSIVVELLIVQYNRFKVVHQLLLKTSSRGKRNQ